MAPPLRTNSAYAHLAYQKSIIRREIIFLRRTFVGDELSDPREVLICEEVFQQDQKVPQEAVQHRIEELTEEAARLDLELHKFQLVVPSPQGHHESKSQKGSGKSNQKGGQGSSQGRRSH